MAKEKQESIKYKKGNIVWETFPEICKSCGFCIEKCPQKCLSFDGGNIDFLGMPTVKCKVEKCTACRVCEQNCPDCAIKVESRLNM